MSILDSQEELTSAQLTVGAASDEELQRDLQFWTIASYDSAEEFVDVNNKLGAIRKLHREEEHWISLIATEIRKRRDGRRATADG